MRFWKILQEMRLKNGVSWIFWALGPYYLFQILKTCYRLSYPCSTTPATCIPFPKQITWPVMCFENAASIFLWKQFTDLNALDFRYPWLRKCHFLMVSGGHCSETRRCALRSYKSSELTSSFLRTGIWRRCLSPFPLFFLFHGVLCSREIHS